MANIFCPQCGAKNTYSLKKPNFCQSCGEKFSAFGLTGDTAKASYAAPKQGRETEEDNIPSLSAKEYMRNHIEIENSAKASQSFESLVNNPLNPEDVEYNKEKKGHKKLTPEEYLKISQSSCRSSRGDYEDIGGAGGE